MCESMTSFETAVCLIMIAGYEIPVTNKRMEQIGIIQPSKELEGIH